MSRPERLAHLERFQSVTVKPEQQDSGRASQERVDAGGAGPTESAGEILTKGEICSLQISARAGKEFPEQDSNAQKIIAGMRGICNSNIPEKEKIVQLQNKLSHLTQIQSAVNLLIETRKSETTQTTLAAPERQPQPSSLLTAEDLHRTSLLVSSMDAPGVSGGFGGLDVPGFSGGFGGLDEPEGYGGFGGLGANPYEQYSHFAQENVQPYTKRQRFDQTNPAQSFGMGGMFSAGAAWGGMGGAARGAGASGATGKLVVKTVGDLYTSPENQAMLHSVVEAVVPYWNFHCNTMINPGAKALLDMIPIEAVPFNRTKANKLLKQINDTVKSPQWSPDVGRSMKELIGPDIIGDYKAEPSFQRQVTQLGGYFASEEDRKAFFRIICQTLARQPFFSGQMKKIQSLMG